MTKIRRCYGCGEYLVYKHYRDGIANYHLPLDYLIEIWENDKIELYCCNCYEDIEKSFRIAESTEGITFRIKIKE